MRKDQGLPPRHKGRATAYGSFGSARRLRSESANGHTATGRRGKGDPANNRRAASSLPLMLSMLSDTSLIRPVGQAILICVVLASVPFILNRERKFFVSSSSASPGPRRGTTAAAAGPVEALAEAAEACAGWSEVDRISCQLSGCQRLMRALQDENCPAARKSRANAKLVGEKIRKLSADGPFTFFRGADGFFFWDMRCEDPQYTRSTDEGYQRVMSNGDTHPENFGVMQQANQKLVWGTNDFDQAMHAPFTWDLKRGAAGFALGCMTDPRYGGKPCDDVVGAWFDGYGSLFAGGCSFTNEDRFVEGAAVLREPWGLAIRLLLNRTRAKFEGGGAATEKWLAKKVDLSTLTFKPTEEVLPLDPKEVAAFREVVHRYLYSGVSALARFSDDESFFDVLDVAQKFGSGTGSIGLDRYLILIRGGAHPRILEMKQVTQSVVEAYTMYDYTNAEEAQRVVTADKAGYPYTNIFYGSITFKGHPFILREKSKFKNDLEWDSLDFKGLQRYAFATGRAQALFHAKVSCMTPECPLKEKALVDKEICEGIKPHFSNVTASASLKIEVVNFASAEAERHIQAYKTLNGILKSADAGIQKRPELLLNTEFIPNCTSYNVTTTGGQ